MQVRKNNYTVNATPTMQVLTEQQIEAIYYAALGVLSETGVRVYDKEGWELAYEGGAGVEDVQADSALVKMPSWMVDKARATLPQRIRVIGPPDADGMRKYNMDLYKNTIYFGTGSDTPFTIDPYTQVRRRAHVQGREEPGKAGGGAAERRLLHVARHHAGYGRRHLRPVAVPGDARVHEQADQHHRGGHRRAQGSARDGLYPPGRQGRVEEGALLLALQRAGFAAEPLGGSHPEVALLRG